MKIGPDSAHQRRKIETQNLGEVEEYLDWYSSTYPGFSISEGLILELHRLTMKGLYSCAGHFRDITHDMEEMSPTFHPAPAYAVEMRIRDIIGELRNREQGSTGQQLKAAIWFFHQFLFIHPFCGGNGRVSRSLLTMLLRKYEIIRPHATVYSALQQRKKRLLASLQSADTGHIDDLGELVVIASIDTLIDQVFETLRMIPNQQPLPSWLSKPAVRARTSDRRLYRQFRQFLAPLNGS